MDQKIISSSVVAAALAYAAFLVPGCGQGADSPEPTESTDPDAAEALTAVQNCQVQARSCFQEAGAPARSADGGPSAAMTCANDLRACLLSVLPDAGARPVLPDAGRLVFPRFDGGFVRPPAFDGGFPRPPAFDGGFQPPAFDGGLPRPPAFDGGFPRPPAFDGGFPRPPVADASVPPAITCIDDMRTCLASQMDPMTCADQARTCLQSAAAGRP